MKILSFICLAAVLSGCASFQSIQSDAFVDDDGNILVAEYGVSSKPYTYTMVSPMNGAKVACTDTKMVRATLPSGERIVCYICQNDSPKGTMYATRDQKWKYLTIGLACRLYLYYPVEDDYLLVFEGTICPSALEEKGVR